MDLFSEAVEIGDAMERAQFLDKVCGCDAMLRRKVDGLIAAHLIEHRYIDCLVSTGANLYHDLHETRGRRHFVGSPRENDAALQADHIDRVYDTYASEDEFVENDEWIHDFDVTYTRA